MWFKKRPGLFVVFLSVGFDEGGVVFDGAFDGATGQGVVHEGFGDGAFLEVFDILPAEGDVFLRNGFSVPRADPGSQDSASTFSQAASTDDG